MSWLENPQNEAEKLVREGLDLAAQRTGDEITHRRVWAKVTDSLLAPEPQRRGRLVFASAGLAVALVAVGALVFYPRLTVKRSGGVAQPQQVTTSLQESKTAPAERTDATPAQVAQVRIDESERAPGTVVRTRKGERAQVGLGGGATADLDENSSITWDSQHRPAIERGTVDLAVPHQPPGWRFSVTAGPYVVTVVGTKFKVEVGGRSVGVQVSEGVVEVWRGAHSTRLVAGDAWHGPLVPDSASGQAPLVMPPAAPAERPRPAAEVPTVVQAAAARPLGPPNRSLQDAESALQSGDTARALEILNRVAQGMGPAAENAAYELARVTRYNLGRPRQAVALWDKYRNRFPNGLLRTEADLSIVETLSQMGEVRAALVEADAFIVRHPTSERRAEIRRLAERLRAAEASSESR
jgi:transmembrane sensor